MSKKSGKYYAKSGVAAVLREAYRTENEYFQGILYYNDVTNILEHWILRPKDTSKANLMDVLGRTYTFESGCDYFGMSEKERFWLIMQYG